MDTVPACEPPRQRATARSVRVVRPGLIRIAEGKSVEHYSVREVPCEIGGRGFSVRKVNAVEPYSVRVGTPEECSCDCLGFYRNRKCRHVSALLALDSRHQLSEAAGADDQWSDFDGIFFVPTEGV